MPKLIAPLLLLLVAAPAWAQTPLRERMLLAEDARPTTDAGLAALQEGLVSPNALERRLAIRAFGRLERPDLIPVVAPFLADGVGLRAEAASALAQMARTPESVVQVQRLLVDRAAVDANLGLWEVWGELASALGRLPYDTPAQVAEAEAVLVKGLPSPDSMNDVEAAALAGATRGFESLSRVSRKVAPLLPRTWDLLRWAATAQRPANDPRSAQARRLAMAALVSGEQATTSIIERALADADDEVRRLAMVAAAGDGKLDGREALLKRGLADRMAHVRWEALRAWGRHLQATSCAPIRAAVRDADPHVMLQAIDLLGAACPSGEGGPAELLALVETLNTQPRTWHAPAHALVALAALQPGDARTALPRYARHPTWQVRMYAARTAAAVGAFDELGALAGDANDNVRHAALAALIEQRRPEAVAAAIEALTRKDYQLVMTASRAFTEPASAGKAVPALVAALARLTLERKDTSRDPRLAILTRLQALGSKSEAAALEGYLGDFDVKVAEKTAEILSAWTGTARLAAPRPLPPMPVTLAAVDAIRGRVLRVTMAGRGTFDIALDVDRAPLAAVRVARRAAEGYYNGLTFHRVAPNFVIQGGSPGANEFAGDALYMRDEVGMHRRATVGISTRGHDTGDAQLFVNLVDSPRLDHLYTVFGTVVAGMDVVDVVVEGDTIESIQLREK